MDTTLAILDKREVGLRDLAKKYKGLKIDGVMDTAGFSVVRAARISLKNERVQIEKDAKTLREGALSFQRAVIGREKELVAIIEPIEDELQAEESRIEAEKEAIRQKKEKEEAAITQARVNALAKFNHGMDFLEAREMSEEKFNELLSQAEVNFNQEKERKAKEAEEQRAEQQRIAAERAELERVRKEQADREATMRAEQERIAKEQEERESKIKAEQEKKYAALMAEQKKLDAERQAFEVQKQVEEREKKRLAELETARKEAAAKAVIEAEEKAKREEQERKEKELLARAEAERLERLRPDKEKINDLAESFKKIKFPDVDSKEALALLGNVGAELVKLSDSLKARAAKL